jgi:hypothetical protein
MATTTAPALSMSHARAHIVRLHTQGRTVDEIDAEVIRRSALRDDQRSALWLYAWALQPRSLQLALAKDMMSAVAHD